MKKIYIKPQIATVATDPIELCAASTNSWHVDHKGDHTASTESSDNYGEIIYDNGSSSTGSYDPFDSSNW